jgi:hypothetical protein
MPKDSVLKNMLDCGHDEITDEGICKACGVDITSQEFMDSLPEPPPDSQLGDIPGIIKVAQETAEEFLRRQAECRDPHNPSQPKFRWVGTQLIRPPRETIWMDVVRPSYAIVKQLGYRGTLQRWDEICMEYVVLVKSTKNSPKK